MRRGLVLLVLLAGCLDIAQQEQVYDDPIDEARIPAGADLFTASEVDGNACRTYDLDRFAGTGSGSGKRTMHLVDAGWLQDDTGHARPVGLCWNGERGSLQTQLVRGNGVHGEGWDLMFDPDVVDVRLWSGHGVVALTEAGALRWYRGDVATVDSSRAVAEVPLELPILDFRVLDDAGTAMAVGPEGLVVVDRSGAISPNDTVTGDRLEASERIAWVRDNEQVTAVALDGTVLWVRTIPGLLHIAGDSDLAATVLDDQGTALRVLDGQSGVQVARISLPDGTHGASIDGTRIVSWEDERVVSWSWRSLSW